MTQVRRRFGPQVLQLLRRGDAAEYLVAVRVAPEARYDVAGGFSLRDPELGHRPPMGRRVCCFLLRVADATLVEGKVLRVAEGEPEEHPLHGAQLAVHPQVDAFEG